MTRDIALPPYLLTWARLLTTTLLFVFALGEGLGATESVTLTLRNEGQTRELTLEEIDALPQHTIVTTNEFTDDPVAYTGPLAREVVALVGLGEADTARFTAVNDYFIDIPVADLLKYDAVLAIRANGKRLSRRDKGPIWLMYPLSDHPELAGAAYNARLIWQVVRIEGR